MKSSKDKKYQVGAVHGRFQPLHNGHMEYIMAGKQQCDFLWIGITQFEIESLARCPAAPHRQRPENNPLTYEERLAIITEALLAEGIARSEFGFIRFPIDIPEDLAKSLPVEIPMFTVVCEDWNNHKIDVLREVGYKVIVLWEMDKRDFDGTIIRDLICKENTKWKSLVPAATIDLLERYELRQRILKLRRSTTG